MTIADLKRLAEQASAASNADAANQVLARAAAMARDESLPASRELAIALFNVAGALVPLGAPGGVEDLFGAVQRMLIASGESRTDDHLLLWHNLGVLYDRHGATELHQQMLARVSQVAANYDGPLERCGADVFLQQGLTYRRHGQTEMMRVMLRQVHRYMMSDACAPAERLAWLSAYAPMLLEAGQTDEAAVVAAQGAELARELGDALSEASLLNSIARSATSRHNNVAALAALQRALAVMEVAPALADSQLGAAVLHNLVGAHLSAADPSRYADALALSERVIDILRGLGQADSDDFAYALYHRAVLTEYLGDWVGAARGYAAAAAVPGAAAANAAEWLSLGGRAWFEAGDFDAASDCYLAAVRRRVANP